MATVDERLTLQRTWSPPPGVIGWLSTVNHRAIGLRFIVTAFIFFLLAGVQALVMRTQLAQPNLGLLSPQIYNQFFTMHGTTMMFLFAVPMMEGIGLYLVPLMIGTRDMSFPRLSAFGYYVFLFAGVALYTSFFLGTAPDSGWFNYVPLSGPVFSPGVGIDIWATMITFLEFSALTAAVELIVTIFRQRAPGMSVNRIPLFVWAILVMAFMIVFAMPSLIVASVMLALDRTLGTHFFNPTAGGDPMLWQHLFWFFGHPEVYIIFVPALGIVSAIIPTFTRRPIWGYSYVALATLVIGFLSFGLWVHHMFAVGLPQLGTTFFAASSIMIGIPSGLHIFAFIATIAGGRLDLKTPMLFVLGFVVIFVLGGITGIMVAAVPFDLQVHDSYFVVAHFHYVLIGGAVFPMLGGLHYWFPKMTGRMPGERLGKWSFWLILIGFNVAFFPMHILGFLGMARRIYTYPAELGWDELNLLSSIGAYALGMGFVIFALNLVYASRRGTPAGDNPWGAGTLEWATSSPPPPYNFERLPSVRSRQPLWDQLDDRVQTGVTVELGDEQRETLATTLLDADPDYRVVVATPSIWPFFLAMAVAITFLGSIIHLAIVPLGALLSYIALIGWNWPDELRPKAEREL